MIFDDLLKRDIVGDYCNGLLSCPSCHYPCFSQVTIIESPPIKLKISLNCLKCSDSLHTVMSNTMFKLLGLINR